MVVEDLQLGKAANRGSETPYQENYIIWKFGLKSQEFIITPFL